MAGLEPAAIYVSGRKRDRPRRRVTMPSFRLSGVVSVNPGGLHHPHSLTTHHFRLPKAIRDARPPAYSACENLRLASVAGLYLSRPVMRRWSRYPIACSFDRQRPSYTGFTCLSPINGWRLAVRRLGVRYLHRSAICPPLSPAKFPLGLFGRPALIPQPRLGGIAYLSRLATIIPLPSRIIPPMIRASILKSSSFNAPPHKR